MTGPEIISIEGLGEAERLALAYAPAAKRANYTALLLLDAQLARIALTSREPALAQLKLAWWRDACADLSAPSGHPITAALAVGWADRAEALTALVDAWEVLAVEEGGGLNAAEQVAIARADSFAAAARTVADDGIRAAARRWTLVTLATHAPNQQQSAAMLAAAGAIDTTRLPRALRPLAILAGLSRRALRRGSGALLGDRLSPLAALRLGIFGR